MRSRPYVPRPARPRLTRQYFSRPTAFVQSHALEDIRLVLGWSSALVTFAAAYYGYVTPFDETKRIVGAGVVLCVASGRQSCAVLTAQ